LVPAAARPHGEVIEDRTVSFLELFYDLVYVVLVGQLAHTLAEDVSWSGVLDFVVVFGLIWIGWFNGAQFHELHGREDGRNRSFIFLQMGSARLAVVLRLPDRRTRVPAGGAQLPGRARGLDRSADHQLWAWRTPGGWPSGPPSWRARLPSSTSS
jgi:hypothetical protein